MWPKKGIDFVLPSLSSFAICYCWRCLLFPGCTESGSVEQNAAFGGLWLIVAEINTYQPKLGFISLCE